MVAWSNEIYKHSIMLRLAERTAHHSNSTYVDINRNQNKLTTPADRITEMDKGEKLDVRKHLASCVHGKAS